MLKDKLRKYEFSKESGTCQTPTWKQSVNSPICREGEFQMVALGTDRLLRHEHRSCGDGPDVCLHLLTSSVDRPGPARDALHLHYISFVEPGTGSRAEEDPMCILHERSAGHIVMALVHFYLQL